MKRGRSEAYRRGADWWHFATERKSDIALRHVRRVDCTITLEKLRDDSYENGPQETISLIRRAFVRPRPAACMSVISSAVMTCADLPILVRQLLVLYEAKRRLLHELFRDCWTYDQPGRVGDQRSGMHLVDLGARLGLQHDWLRVWRVHLDTMAPAHIDDMAGHAACEVRGDPCDRRRRFVYTQRPAAAH
jgi:hypothetical protein